jgi:hypothetical protein
MKNLPVFWFEFSYGTMTVWASFGRFNCGYAKSANGTLPCFFLLILAVEIMSSHSVSLKMIAEPFIIHPLVLLLQ